MSDAEDDLLLELNDSTGNESQLDPQPDFFVPIPSKETHDESLDLNLLGQIPFETLDPAESEETWAEMLFDGMTNDQQALSLHVPILINEEEDDDGKLDVPHALQEKIRMELENTLRDAQQDELVSDVSENLFGSAGSALISSAFKARRNLTDTTLIATMPKLKAATALNEQLSQFDDETSLAFPNLLNPNDNELIEALGQATMEGDSTASKLLPLMGLGSSEQTKQDWRLFDLPRFPDGKQFIHIADNRPFDPFSKYSIEEQSDAARVVTAHNVIRWSRVNDGIASNARFITWSDHSETLHIGADVFALHRVTEHHLPFLAAPRQTFSGVNSTQLTLRSAQPSSSFNVDCEGSLRLNGRLGATLVHTQVNSVADIMQSQLTQALESGHMEHEEHTTISHPQAEVVSSRLMPAMTIPGIPTLRTAKELRQHNAQEPTEAEQYVLEQQRRLQKSSSVPGQVTTQSTTPKHLADVIQVNLGILDDVMKGVTSSVQLPSTASEEISSTSSHIPRSRRERELTIDPEAYAELHKKE